MSKIASSLYSKTKQNATLPMTPSTPSGASTTGNSRVGRIVTLGDSATPKVAPTPLLPAPSGMPLSAKVSNVKPMMGSPKATKE